MKYKTIRDSLCASLLLGSVAGCAAAQRPTKSAGAEAPRGMTKQSDFEHARPQVEQSYAVGPGGSTPLELPRGSATLELPTLANAPAPTNKRRLVDTDTEKRPVADEARSGIGQRKAGWVISGVGVVALGVGGYFGVRAFSKWSERKDNCVDGCNSAAKNAGDDAKSAALVSEISIGLGLVGVALGTYLVLHSKSSQPSAAGQHAAREAPALQLLPALAPTGGGLLVRGAY